MLYWSCVTLPWLAAQLYEDNKRVFVHFMTIAMNWRKASTLSHKRSHFAASPCNNAVSPPLLAPISAYPDRPSLRMRWDWRQVRNIHQSPAISRLEIWGRCWISINHHQSPNYSQKDGDTSARERLRLRFMRGRLGVSHAPVAWGGSCGWLGPWGVTCGWLWVRHEKNWVCPMWLIWAVTCGRLGLLHLINMGCHTLLTWAVTYGGLGLSHCVTAGTDSPPCH